MTYQTKTAAIQADARIIEFPARPTSSEPAASALRRPPTLVRAARWRAARYRRARDLPRLASGLAAMRAGSDALLERLREIEDECWRALRGDGAHYVAERHILALAALIGEGGSQARAAGQRAQR